MSAADYGRTLTGLSVNLIVRDIERSVPFYTRVLEMRRLYSDEDFADFEREGVRLQLHADHTYAQMPWAARLREGGARGLGAEMRILGLDPDAAEKRARHGGFNVLVAVRGRPPRRRGCGLGGPGRHTFPRGGPPWFS